MSEYRYYEFQAIDRRLTAGEMARLRSFSSDSKTLPSLDRGTKTRPLALLAGEEVRASEAGDNSFHAIGDRAGEVDEFLVQPIVDGRSILCAHRLDCPNEVLR